MPASLVLTSGPDSPLDERDRLPQVRPVPRPVPWTNAIGLARSIVGLGTLGTLLANDPDTLFRPAGIELSSVPRGATRNVLDGLSLFTLLPGSRLWIAQAIAIAILAVVVSGWRPRWTALPHLWVVFSVMNSCVIIDGGDHVSMNLTLLTLPIVLTDPRRWHWDPPPETTGRPRWLAGELAWSVVWLVRLQMCVIYLHAATGKLQVQEWVNGTALYYWFSHPVFGIGSWASPVVLPLIRQYPVVVAVTWGAIVLELLLVAGIIAERRFRPWLLVAGVLFHFGIMLIHGLVSFFCAMTGGLILYLWQLDRPLPIGHWYATARRIIRRPAAGRVPVARDEATLSFPLTDRP